MNGVGKVDDVGAHRQVDNIALRGEDENFFRRKVRFNGADKIGNVAAGLVLVVEHVADPLQTLVERIVLLVAARHAELILPVCGDTVLRRVVHFPCTDLHFERNSLLADNRCVQRLVHIRLRGGDIILKSVRDRGVHIVDDAEHVVAINDAVYDDAQCKNIVDLLEGLALQEHLLIDAVDGLYTAREIHTRNRRLDAVADNIHRVVDEFAALRADRLKVLFDLFICDRVEITEGNILHILLYVAHTEAVRDRCIHFETLECLISLLLRCDKLERCEIVHTVRKLDDDNADILAHCHEHLSKVLRLLLFTRGERDLTELCYTVCKVCNFFAEDLRHIVVCALGVLNDIMQQTGDNGRGIHTEFNKSAGNGYRVNDIRLTGFADLMVVCIIRIMIRLLNHSEVVLLVARHNEPHKIRICF